MYFRVSYGMVPAQLLSLLLLCVSLLPFALQDSRVACPTVLTVPVFSPTVKVHVLSIFECLAWGMTQKE